MQTETRRLRTASDVAAGLCREAQALIGENLKVALGEPTPLPVGAALFARIEETGFLDRFWLIFGGNPNRWGGFPVGEELNLPRNHLDQRLWFANCSFDPLGVNGMSDRKIATSCAFVARVVQTNVANPEMWGAMQDCLGGADFVLVMALIVHRFETHYN